MDVFYSTDEGEYLFHVDKAVTVVEHEGGTANCKDKAVCTKCGKPYGETNPENHKEEFKHYDAKSATVAEVGNIEYWYCAACDKYYSDKNGNTEITKEETVLAKITPEIINGSAQIVIAGENKELTFRSNAAFADFIRVEVDGVVLDAMSYTVKEGSTIVTLKADYVATLLAGEHTLDIVSESGIATTSFTVNEKVVNDETSPVVEENDASPTTGDNSHMALWLTLLLVSGSLLAVTGIFGKKKIME